MKQYREIFNIGSNQEISIYFRDTFRIICQLMEKDTDLLVDADRLRPPNSEVFRLWCDNAKLKKLTGFSPKYSFINGMKETIKWFTEPANLIKYKSNIYNK